jgi:N-methylhydantoinase A
MKHDTGMIVAVDIGGTFTDLVAYDPTRAQTMCTKSLTTYGDFAAGIFECIAKLKLPLERAALIKHGTTLVINALIQRNGARTALLCTQGFRDTLEIGRGNRPLPFDLSYRRDPPMVPREWRLEVAERIDAQGNVLTPLDEAGVAAAGRRLADAGVEAIAISFLNAYANPANEQRAVELLERQLPDVYVTSGIELSREWHEYERTATAAANAYVGPLVSRYLEGLEAALVDRGYPGQLLMMGSSGGMLSAQRAARIPVILVESGPIGGCIGAAALARSLGIEQAIAFDMGGTTAKCAMVEQYGFHVETAYYVGGYERGFPIRAPILDIVEVGAGGGSVAWLDKQNRLHVGPRSAGSHPGPICYGRGGVAPTVTDANLLLGRLNEARFLGGEMRLNSDAARNIMRDSLAGPLGYDGAEGVRRLASGIVRIAVLKMAGAIRQVTVTRGKDPRDVVLIAYGGGGPLHAVELARELQIPKVIIPPEPGSFSASGMLLADLRSDRAVTFLSLLTTEAIARGSAEASALSAEAAAELSNEAQSGVLLHQWYAELRYVGQHHTLRVPFDTSMTPADLDQAFSRLYQAAYGHANHGMALEFVGVAVTVTSAVAKPAVAALRRVSSGRSVPVEREAFSALADRTLPMPVYDRYSLAIGEVIHGPAVIEEYGSTTLIDQGDRAVVGVQGELCIDCAPAASRRAA